MINSDTGVKEIKVTAASWDERGFWDERELWKLVWSTIPIKAGAEVHLQSKNLKKRHFSAESCLPSLFF